LEIIGVERKITSGNRRILIVDDNIQIHEDFKKIFSAPIHSDPELDNLEKEMFGPPTSPPKKEPDTFELSTAEQGQEGARMVRSARTSGRPYALAFVDMRMPPGWDGVQTIEQMWKHDPDLEIVICTAYSDRSWRELSETLKRPEQFLVLKKPFDSIEAKQLAASLCQKWEFSRINRCRLEDLQSTVIERTTSLDLISGQNRRILEWVGQPILAIDGNGTINLANQSAAEVLGYSVEDLNGKSFHETVHPNQSCADQCRWRNFPCGPNASEAPSGHLIEDFFCREDGTQIGVEIVYQEARDSNGTMNGAVIMFCGKI
jgi:PAS domain S-box-containing protein